MYIAICDDEQTALNQIKDAMQEVLHEKNVEFTISEFTNEAALLADPQSYELIFLDIELNNPATNGVEVAKLLKKKNPSCNIIFVTNYEEYIDDVIEEYAFRFWSKPIDKYRLSSSVQVLLNRIQSVSFKEFKTKKNLTLPQNSIIYIAAENRGCRIVTTDNTYIANTTFKDFKTKLDMNCFCNSHGSYCVNLNYVEKYTKSEVYLAHNYKVHMSRRYYQSFKNQMYILGGEKV